MAAVLNLQVAYALMVLLGVALLLLLRPARAYSSPERRQYWRLQAITLIAALLGAKFAVLMGDALWPLRPFDDWAGLLLSGRSIVGALLFGFLAAEAAKPLLRYPLPPNDRFAVILPFSIATGRIGCLMAGCCLGIESDGPLAMRAADGAMRIPAPLIELSFHVLAGVALLQLLRHGVLRGRLFASYLVGYGAFRFVSEFWRVTEKAFAGFSAYQWMALAMIVAGATALWLRRESKPSAATPALANT